MTRWRGPRRYGGPWYGNDARRVLFERAAKDHFSTLQAVTRTSGPKAGRTYAAVIDVPHYEPRRVQIHFGKRTPRLPRITTDGPTESTHRYDDGRICIWHPDDPDDSRWIFDDGLLLLLGLIAAHLFREAWWRETGEWLGPEASHAVSPDQQGENAA